MNTPPVDFVRVEAGAHTEFLERCLKTCGLAHDHAEFMASRLTWADLRGIHSHGLLRQPHRRRFRRQRLGGQSRRSGSVQSQYRQAVAVDDGFQLILIQTR